jgi:AraC-like DNA-binding protein
MTTGSSTSVSAAAILCNADTAGVHEHATVSYVTRGSVTYTSRGIAAELVPGSIIVAKRGVEYQCTHRRGTFGQCVSFRFSPEAASELERGTFTKSVVCLPPLASTVTVGALSDPAMQEAIDFGLDEIGILLAERVEQAIGTGAAKARAPTRVERSKMVDMALRIDACSHETLGLDRLSQDAGLSPFHFLRLFARVIGATPHQYLLRCRLRKAAEMLAAGRLPITEVALASGFEDLSNFIRSFRRATGKSPRAFRSSLAR